jgi:hypothetical protein
MANMKNGMRTYSVIIVIILGMNIVFIFVGSEDSTGNASVAFKNWNSYRHHITRQNKKSLMGYILTLQLSFQNCDIPKNYQNLIQCVTPKISVDEHEDAGYIIIGKFTLYHIYWHDAQA